MQHKDPRVKCYKVFNESLSKLIEAVSTDDHSAQLKMLCEVKKRLNDIESATLCMRKDVLH
jgi:hypothetical protein